MSITYKWTVTKPSLDHVFGFEPMLLELYISSILQGKIPNSQGSLGYNNTYPMAFVKPVGYIGSHVENIITWQEITSRIEEVRADLRDFLISPCYEYGLTGQIPLDFFKDSGAVPPFNPFTTSYTLVMEFDTWDNFTSAYDADEGNDYVFSNNGTPMGLDPSMTFDEEAFEDGVSKEFVGKWIF